MSSTFKTDDSREQPAPRAERREEARQETRREEPRGEQRGGGLTFSDMGRVQMRPSMGGISDAALSTMVQAFDLAKKKRFENPNLPAEIRRHNFHLIPLDSRMTATPQPSLLVALPILANGCKVVLVYILVIEQPGEPMTRPLTERNETFEALVLPEDQLNKRYLAIVKEQVASLGEEAVMVGSQVILHDTIATISEEDPQGRIAAIFDNALDAVAGFRENILDSLRGSRSSENRITPKSLGPKERLEVTFDYSGKQIVDSSGLPIRSDSTSILYHSEATPDDIETYSRRAIAETRTGLDLFVSVDEEDDDTPRFGGRRRSRRDRDREPYWQAVLNVNSIAAMPGVPFSLELAQLALSVVALQSNDYRWATMLRPRSTGGHGLISQMVDLGKLPLMCPDDEFAHVAEGLNSNISDEELGDFLDVTVKPKLAFGMTVPSSGERSWVLSIFERIAMSKPGDRQYVNTLFDSAKVLTGGHFEDTMRDWNIDERDYRPIYDTGTRTLLGYWTDDFGNRRDLREWANPAAVLTAFGEKHIGLARDFQATFEDTRYSIERNLADRYSMMRKFVKGMHVVASAAQLAIDPNYLGALSEALDRAGLSPHVSSADGLHTRRRIGHTLYSGLAGSNLGVGRRGRDEASNRRSRGIFGGNYY